MKTLTFLTFLISLALQVEMMAQPNPYYNNRTSSQLEVQAQQTPSYNDNDGQNPAGNAQPAIRPGQNRPTNSVNPPPTNNAYAPPQNTDELRPKQKIEWTLSILKPDVLKNRHIGDIISRFEDAGLRVAAIKMVQLTPEQAAQFYSIHREKPFFPELVQYMSSGPIVAMVLEGDRAISKNRELMGETDPRKAAKGTIRADFAESISHNAVHGSDSPESARQEIAFFFLPNEIYSGYTSPNRR
jgi:nucleoside-diphosphate kinase